jgi:thiamine pyrophosphate-dependent acetolactate synthase large subunit-like protein
VPESQDTSANQSVSIKRRSFLKVGVAGAAAVVLPAVDERAAAQEPQSEDHIIKPTPVQEGDPSPSLEFQSYERTGADFMADVLKTLPIDYLCSNPADKTAGLQESLTGPYGGNKNPEWITCTHEEISVAMGHGYYKIEGRMLAMAGHSTVGLMHAAMAVYNAYCDRVPVYLIFGNFQQPTNHAAIDASAPIREFIRWYTNPMSLSAFAENAVRAFALASTPPTLPVLVTIDADMQESPIKGREPKIPKLTIPEPPSGDENSVRETARLLAQAQNPVLIADRYARTQAGMDRLVELAELLQAPVIDHGARMNFPTRHSLNQTYSSGGLITDADVVLGLETNMAGVSNQTKGKTISLGADGLLGRANYLEIGHYGSVDLAMSGDAEATMPALIEAVKQQLGSNQRVAAEARKTKLAERTQKAFERARVDMTYAWDASPISTARLTAEIWEAVKNEDWSLPSFGLHYGFWPQRTWPMDKHYHANGGMGGNGEGYNAPAALGAALANKKHGRITVNIQCDGDLLYCPGVLWTAAHHQIPILNVMHNNRAYHQEMMYVERVANRHNHLLAEGGIGLKLENPNIDFAKMAQSMGVYAEGPITNPNDLGPALKRAVAVVKKGQPALLDVITQPR